MEEDYRVSLFGRVLLVDEPGLESSAVSGHEGHLLVLHIAFRWRLVTRWVLMNVLEW